jgi:hypothetical protein
MSTAAERQRRFRQRQALGLRCFPIELPEFALADALIESGRLTEAESADPAAVARAVERLVGEFIKKTVTRYGADGAAACTLAGQKPRKFR